MNEYPHRDADGQRDSQYAYTRGNLPYNQRPSYERPYYTNNPNNFHAGSPGQGSQTGQPGRKKGGLSKLGAVALVLVCALFGFGGGMLAVNLMGSTPQQTVVYKVPENTLQPAADLASGEGSTLSEVAAAAGQSVVSITTENVVADFALGGRIVSGAGSGVIITEDGYIITNNHVVEGARNVTVTLPDGSDHNATVVGTDAATDIAVLKIEVTGLVPAVLGDSDQLAVGDFCLAIGNPLGTLGGTVTDGIVSALNRSVNIDGNSMNLLQMSAAVSPGNSGGGLFNTSGQLIGIVNAKSDGNGAEGLGFAIPVNTAMNIAQQLIEDGYVSGRPALGIEVRTVTTSQQMLEAGVSEAGLYIASVNSGSAADQAGLAVGDRIVSVDGVAIETSDQIGSLISAKSVGDTIELVVQRNGGLNRIVATLGEMALAA